MNNPKTIADFPYEVQERAAIYIYEGGMDETLAEGRAVSEHWQERVKKLAKAITTKKGE